MKPFSLLFALCAGTLPIQSGVPPLSSLSSSSSLPVCWASSSGATDELPSYNGHGEIEGAALTCMGAAICCFKRRRPL